MDTLAKTIKHHASSSGNVKMFRTSLEQQAVTNAILQMDSLDFIFDVFSEMIPFFRTYTAYCNNFDLAQTKLHQCLASNSKFAKFMERCRNDPQFTGLDLEDLLIQPVQRICRYPLLFGEALKYMLTSHPQYNKVLTINDAIKGIAAEVDKARDVANNSKILHALHCDVFDSKVRPLKFTDTNFIIPSRWFIRRFTATFRDRYEPLHDIPCSIFIFNDLVLVTTNKILGRRESNDSEDNSKQYVKLIAEYILPMSGIKCSLKSRLTHMSDKQQKQDGAGEMSFTCSVNTKAQTAVFKFTVNTEKALEAQMMWELLGELQKVNHKNEAKKSELGSVGKRSWVCL
jgi:hypothetical protein